MTTYLDPDLPAIFTENQKELRKFDRDFIQVVDNWALNLKSILDRGISLDDNIDAAAVSFTSNGSADTEDAIAHTLGKVPAHFIVSSLDKGAVVYRSGTAFTKTTIYLKTTVASVAVKVILL